MGKYYIGLLGAVSLFFLVSGGVMAQHSHDHGMPPTSSKKSTSPAGPQKGAAQSITVEGWKVSFEVMSMGEHMKHMSKGTRHSQADPTKSHSIMVSIQDPASKEMISDAQVKYTLSTPTGGTETGKLTWSGDHYGGGFSPKEKGAYQIRLKIESGGMEREATFKYTAK
jgi:hypothetical protein